MTAPDIPEKSKAPVEHRVRYADVMIAQGHGRHGVTEGSSAQINTPGPIKEMNVPASWRKLDTAPAGLPRCYHSVFRNPAHPDISIGLHSTGLPTGESGEALAKILHGGAPKVIYSDKWQQEPGWTANDHREKAAEGVLKQIAGALDPNTVGNNQLTNHRRPPDPNAPLVQLTKVEVKTVNGKPVLSTEGYFDDPATGHPVSYFSSIYVPLQTSSGVEVHNAVLQAKNHDEFMQNRIAFQKSLASIKWEH